MGGIEAGGGLGRINVGCSSEDGNDGGRMSSSSSSSTSLIQRRPSSGSLSMLEGIYRKSFSSYKKLPQEPLKLSVLKLDGTCFDIEVMRTATVMEVKEAVESVFSDIPISWKHLWGRFCLSYGGQKLVVETEYINDYGIKDGDELHFIRHASGTPSLGRKASGKLMPRTSSHEMRIEEEERNGAGDIESGSIKHPKSEDDLCTMIRASSQGLFSYSKLTMVEYKDEVATLDCRSNCVEEFWRRFRKIMVFCGASPPKSQKESWRDD